MKISAAAKRMLWVLFPRIQTQLRSHFARRKYDADIDLYQWFQVCLSIISLQSSNWKNWSTLIFQRLIVRWILFQGIKILLGKCRRPYFHGLWRSWCNHGESSRTKKFWKRMFLFPRRNPWHNWSGKFLRYIIFTKLEIWVYSLKKMNSDMTIQKYLCFIGLIGNESWNGSR